MQSTLQNKDLICHTCGAEEIDAVRQWKTTACRPVKYATPLDELREPYKMFLAPSPHCIRESLQDHGLEIRHHRA